jgi:hypothetical protein
MHLTLIILKDIYTIYKFKPDSDIPDWIKNSDFYSVTKTKDELSVVSKQIDLLTETQGINKDWTILRIQGPLDFSLIGIIAEISGILEEAKISIFTISTYDTDFILVKNKNLIKAIDSIKANGHKIKYEK